MIIKQIPGNYSELGIALPDPAQVVDRRFPDFLIIGPWRTGTTWLAEMMRNQDGLFITDPKEPLYFSSLTQHHKGVPKEFLWYLDLFNHAPAMDTSYALMGEASATYATRLSVDVIRFIYEINPAIRIIFGIRHPVDRAWSHMKMNIVSEPEAFAHLSEKQKFRKAIAREYIIDAGMYSRHLAKWMSVIPTDQIFLFHFDKLRDDPVEAFTEICDFLDPHLTADSISGSVTAVGKVGGTQEQAMPGWISRCLTREYKAEFEVLARQYHIRFKDTVKSWKQAPPLVLTGSRPLNYSETFINAHIRGLGARTLSLQNYAPLSISKDTSQIMLGVKKLRTYLNARRLHYKLKREGGSILVEYGTTAAYALPALKDLKQKIVIHFHGFDAHKNKVVAQNARAYSELFKIADAIVVVSSAMKQALINLGADVEKIHHIVCGVDIAMFHPTNVAENPPIFFACGRFVQKKAPHLTIRAFHQAWQQNPLIRLRMGGDGALWKDCQNLVVDLGLVNVIELLGIIDHEQVANELKACRAFVQHSVVAGDGDMEGTPVGILEAGSCAVPTIASRHAGIMDAIIDLKTGILFDEHDVDAMAAAILFIAGNPEQAGAMGRRAREYIAANYSVELSTARLRSLLL